MRCFISINLSEEVKKQIQKTQNILPEFEGKKVELKNLHLTLKFLGEVDEEKIEIVKNKLRRIKLPSFNAELGEIGVFSENFVRIIWIRLKGCENLQKEIDFSLEEFFKKEERFMGHLTIARVKNVEDKIKFIQELKKISVSKMNFEVKEFHLMKSELTKKGTIYSSIENYPLKN
ncbi:MAG: RNA 2',3'-cyclic phosphodiesterase [archaeon]